MGPKAKFSTLTLVMMLLLSSMMLLPGVDAATWSDADFEEGKDGWTTFGAGGGTVMYRDYNVSHSGTYSMKGVSSASTGTSYATLTSVIGSSGVYYLDFWVYPASLDSGGAPIDAIPLYIPSTGSGNSGLTIYTTDEGDIIYENTTTSALTDTGLNINIGEWNRIQANVSTDHKHFQIRVNNGTAVPCYFDGTPASITTSYLGDCASGSGGGTIYFDDVRIDTDPSLWDIEEGALPPLAWTTYPLAYCHNGTAYYYDANVTQADKTFALYGNATWLEVNDTTGNVTGTPSEVGYWDCLLSCTNGTVTIWQNWTIRAYDDFWAVNNARYYSTTDAPQSQAVYCEENGYIYFTYLGPGLNPSGGDPAYNHNLDTWIGIYDNTNHTFLEPTRAYENTIDDQHSQGSIIVDQDGYIHSFSDGHETTINQMVSDAPHNISSFTESTAPCADGSYPRAWVCPENGTIYFMYRKTVTMTSAYRQSLKISEDDGETWSSEIALIDTGTASPHQLSYHNNWLFEQTGSGDWLAWTAWVVHYYDLSERRNVYCAYYNLTDGNMYNVAGESQGVTISRAEMENCIVYNSSTDKAYCAYVARGGGETYVYSSGGESDYQARIWRWNVSSWEQIATFDVASYYVPSTIIGQANGDLVLYLIDETTDMTGLERWEYNLSAGEWLGEGTVRVYGVPLQTHYQTTSKVVAGMEGLNMIMLASNVVDATTDQRLFLICDSGYIINGTRTEELEPPETDWDPVFTSSAKTTALTNRAYTYQAICNESVTFTLTTSATWLSMSGSGLLTGTPTRTGSYSVSIKAENEHNGTAWQIFTITVSNPSSPDGSGGGGGGGGGSVSHGSSGWLLYVGAGAIALLILMVLMASMGGSKGRKGGSPPKRRR